VIAALCAPSGHPICAFGVLPSPRSRLRALSLCRRPRTGRRQSRGRCHDRATWTAERVEQLRSFVVTGLTCSQIAAEIGVTPQRRHRAKSTARLVASAARGCPGAFLPSRVRAPRRTRRTAGAAALDPAAQAPGVSHDAAAVLTPIDSAQRCSLLEIAQDKCHWPIGDPHQPRILRFAVTRRSPASHTAPVTPAWQSRAGAATRFDAPPIAPRRREGVPAHISAEDARMPGTRCPPARSISVLHRRRDFRMDPQDQELLRQAVALPPCRAAPQRRRDCTRLSQCSSAASSSAAPWPSRRESAPSAANPQIASALIDAPSSLRNRQVLIGKS